MNYRKFMYWWLYSNKFPRMLITLIIFISIVYSQYIGWSYHLSWSIAVCSSYFIWGFFSFRVRDNLQQGDFTGYWEYQNIPDDLDESSFDQAPDVKRFVKIDRDKESLRIRIWLLVKSEICLFDVVELSITELNKKSGRLFYWYRAPDNAPIRCNFLGLVVLKWDKENLSDPIKVMVGRYYGHKSKSMGVLHYKRITESEFNLAISEQ